jgi:N12 class adenine-specific DNA methylase
MDFHKRISDDFTKWLAGKPENQESVLSTYQRLFRGYVLPEFPPDPLPIQRWGNRITPKPHQRSGAWRLIKSNGGLLAYDVGVGKTLTGIAAIAYLRQIGRARRPLIIVPNSIIWKWHREITRALPDYSVAVIGSVRYLGRGGVYRSRLDESAERLTKWASFQAGLYDVALVTYSVFSYTSISKESLKLFVEETPAQLRALGLKSAKLEEELEDLEKLYKKRKQLLVDIAEMERDGEADGDTQDD